MKKILYGTTALVAAGLAAGQADAASGLKLGITGYYRGAAGVVIGGDSTPTINARTIGGSPTGFGGQGDFAKTNGGFRQDIRINFTGEVTLDNGMTVGALVQLFGENTESFSRFHSTTPIYRSHVDFKGKFGDIRFGEDGGVLNNMCVYDPGNVTSNFGVNSPAESFSNGGLRQFAGGVNGMVTVGVAPLGSIGTCEGVESRGTKIEYYTPSFGGFQLGVSYAPTGSGRFPGGGYFYGTDPHSTKENVVSVGADYNHDFGGGFTLTAGGAAEWALDSKTSLGASLPDKPAVYTGGFQVGIPGGFAVGADFAYYQNYLHGYYSGASDASGSDDGWVTSAGVSYTIDAVSIGLQGIYSRWGVYGATPFSSHDSTYGVSLNGSYALGPGINLEAQVAYDKYDANGSFAPGLTPLGNIQPADYDAVEIDGGFAINF